MHKFDLKDKALIVEVGGFFTPDEAKSFITEYESIVKKLDTKNFLIPLLLVSCNFKHNAYNRCIMVDICKTKAYNAIGDESMKGDADYESEKRYTSNYTC